MLLVRVKCVRRLGLLLTIRTTHRPASDLGYLLHKNPARVQTFDQSFGRAVVFYPEASTDACTAALLLDVDSVRLVRGRSREDTGPLAQYVNDRPYVASSFLSVAIGHVLRSAMAGRSEERSAAQGGARYVADLGGLQALLAAAGSAHSASVGRDRPPWSMAGRIAKPVAQGRCHFSRAVHTLCA